MWKCFCLCQIDLSKPLGPQGPFDVIVHKLSDVIVEAEHDSQSQQLLANFQVILLYRRTAALQVTFLLVLLEVMWVDYWLGEEWKTYSWPLVMKCKWNTVSTLSACPAQGPFIRGVLIDYAAVCLSVSNYSLIHAISETISSSVFTIPELCLS